MDGGDEDVDGFVDEAASAVDDDHGAVLEITDALTGFFAFAKDEDAHALAGKNGGAESVGEKIDVENADALNAGDFVEIEIVGDDLGLEAESEFDEFAIDFAGVAGNVVDDADFERLKLLDALQDFEAAASALAAEAVWRIGNGLKFAQDELRDEERAVEEVGFADLGDAAVNEDAGVEELGVGGDGGQRMAQAEQVRERTGFECKEFARAERDSEIAKSEKSGEFEKRFHRLGFGGARNDGADEKRGEGAENASHGAAEKRGRRRTAEAVFSQENQGGESEAGGRRGPSLEAEGRKADSTSSSGNRQTTSEKPGAVERETRTAGV